MHLKGLIISVSINYWPVGNSKSIAEEDLDPDSLQLGHIEHPYQLPAGLKNDSELKG